MLPGLGSARKSILVLGEDRRRALTVDIEGMAPLGRAPLAVDALVVGIATAATGATLGDDGVGNPRNGDNVHKNRPTYAQQGKRGSSSRCPTLRTLPMHTKLGSLVRRDFTVGSCCLPTAFAPGIGR